MTSPIVDSDSMNEFEEVMRPLKEWGSPSRVNLDPDKVDHGLSKLVLAIVELLRQLLEKQAIGRIEAGSLSMEEIDRVGITLMKLEKKIKELQEHFGIDDLNINLGPLGNLID